jgi:DUF4097 and DUF4098 domain-containing protein YvlB
MKTSRVLFLSVFALVAAGPIVRAEKTFIIEQSRSRARVAEPQRSNDDWCRDDEGSRDYERFCEVRPLTMAAPSTLKAETSNGSIAVTGTSRRDVSIQAKITAQAPTLSEARDLVADVKITTTGGEIVAEGPRMGSGHRGWWVSYRIETPAHQNVDVGSSNGSVTLTGLDGVLRADTSNGSVHANDLSGDVKVTTSNGSLQVTLNGSTWVGAGLEATTSNGSLRVDMPREYNAHLIARTANGGLNVDRPITMQGRIGREIDTNLGRGGPTLRFHTSNGSLNIREK